MKIVVCVHEPLLRQRISALVESHGDRILAETDTASEAAEVAERFGAEAIVVDLSAQLWLGRHPLDELDRPNRPYHLVVSTDQAAEIASGRPNVSVVSRYDEQALLLALDRLADPRGVERRRNSDRALPPRDAAATYDSATTFFEALNSAAEGDVLIALTLADDGWLDTLGTDCRRVVRRSDFVLRQSREILVFMPDGDREEPGTALARIKRAWDRPYPIMALRRVIRSGDSPSEVFVDTVRRLHDGGGPSLTIH